MQREAIAHLIGHDRFTIVNCERVAGGRIVLGIADHAAKTSYKVDYNPWTKTASLTA